MKLHLSIKVTLYKECMSIVRQRLEEIESRLAAIKEARDNETKSSVGDKYETGRAMMQMEEDNFSRQLVQAREVVKRLSTIAPNKTYEKAALGSLISTTKGLYFLAIGLGKVVVDGKTYFCISVDSPIGKVLLNKQPGDTVSFNQNEIRIIEIL
ncbi:MAG: GreA/GreB family elongation factor [Bacteroidota bacterium]